MKNKFLGLRCKICDAKTSILGVCDFNKTCEEEKNKKVFSWIGFPVYYHQCENCNFIFTTDFDQWSIEDFILNIYNDDYIKVDPDYNGERPKFCFSWFSPMLNGDKSINILDYGAGNDLFSKELNNHGYKATGWDPMWQKEPTFNLETKFDVVTAFEVLEHTPTPLETLDQMIKFIDSESGQIVFSTLVNDIIGDQGLNYWYLAPRNGHVCMHSQKSLQIMFDKVGMDFQSFSPSQHIAFWK